MKIYVKELGAACDGLSQDTSIIQNAIDKCSQNGGGTVILSPGKYLTCSLYLKDNVELHLEAGAILQGSSNPEDYDDFRASGFKHEFCAENSSKFLIGAVSAKNIAITGSGEINGAGPGFYNTDEISPSGFYAKPNVQRPRMVMFYDCSNVRFENTLFKDSPCWTFWLIACDQVNIRGIKVIGDQRMINNDGIDIDSCQNVSMSDCYIKTGDDSLILRAIQKVLERTAICENITVTNCVFDSKCQGIRMGCPNDNIIRNCTFSNIVINGSGTGINFDNPKIYSSPGIATGLDMYDIVFSNITITSERWPIKIWIEDGLKIKKITGVSFSNVRAKSKYPLLIEGTRDNIIEDISFSDVSLFTSSDSAVVCKNCRRISMNNVQLSNHGID